MISICIISPDMNGGIRRLFDQILSAADHEGQLRLDWFVSNTERAGNMTMFPVRLARLAVDAKNGRHDLYHINLASNGSTLRKWLYAGVLRAFGRRYVVHLHGGRYREFYRQAHPILRAGVENLFRRAARVIVLGEVWRKFVIEEIGVSADRTVVLPNAVQAPKAPLIHEPDEMPRLLFLGQLGIRKGVPELLDALARAEMRALQWQATIAGDGDVELYRNRAHELGLADRIEFPGWVNGEQVSALLTRANILVLPSRAENLPLSMLEGMGYGLCPVVTPVGAVPDVIVDGENGLLVPAKDASALAQTLARVCADGTLRATIARRARADFLARYDIKNYRAQLEAIYLDALGAQ